MPFLLPESMSVLFGLLSFPSSSSMYSVGLESTLLSWLSAPPFSQQSSWSIGGRAAGCSKNLLSCCVQHLSAKNTGYSSAVHHRRVKCCAQLNYHLYLSSQRSPFSWLPLGPHLSFHCTRSALHTWLYVQILSSFSSQVGRLRCTNSEFRREMQICLVREWRVNGIAVVIRVVL